MLAPGRLLCSNRFKRCGCPVPACSARARSAWNIARTSTRTGESGGPLRRGPSAWDASWRVGTARAVPSHEVASTSEVEGETGDNTRQASTSGSSTSWPAGQVADSPQQPASEACHQESSSAGHVAASSTDERTGGRAREHRPRAAPPEPPYAVAYAYRTWTSRTFRNYKLRPDFLEAFPVPAGKTFNVNSFLGPKDAQKGQYYVPQPRYRQFLDSYVLALEDGYQMYLTENYQQQVYKYFVELDWDWDTDLARVMEVTPLLIELISATASDHYGFPFANVITSIRTPYKVHLNYPPLLTTELLASGCRDRVLAAIREHPRLCGLDVDWERLIDFPHGSLRLMGSKKAPWMDSDPEWVAQQDKAYAPAKLGPDGRWRPMRMTPSLLAAASIFPRAEQVAAFERSPAYLDMIFNDYEASKQRMEERRRRRMELREQYQQSGPPVPQAPLPPGSSKLPLSVSLEVQPDERVALKIYIKSKYRTKAQPKYKSSMRPGAGQPGEARTSGSAVQEG